MVLVLHVFLGLSCYMVAMATYTPMLLEVAHEGKATREGHHYATWFNKTLFIKNDYFFLLANPAKCWFPLLNFSSKYTAQKI